MWQLKTPVDQLLLRTLCVFIALLIFLRILGKKHLGELSNFDFIVLLIISESVQPALIDNEKSVTGGIIVSGTLLALSAMVNNITFASKKIERVIEGHPEILIRNGKVFSEVLRKEKISQAELEESLRLQGAEKVSDVELAVLEANGKISVIKK